MNDRTEESASLPSACHLLLQLYRRQSGEPRLLNRTTGVSIFCPRCLRVKYLPFEELAQARAFVSLPPGCRAPAEILDPHKDFGEILYRQTVSVLSRSWQSD